MALEQEETARLWCHQMCFPAQILSFEPTTCVLPLLSYTGKQFSHIHQCIRRQNWHLRLIQRKIARVTMLPMTHGEEFNILRYEIGQKYDAHYDAFNPAEYGPQQSQRVASFLLYLSNVEAGGETMFPFEDGMNIGRRYDYKECIGLKVKPRQGDGLLFYSSLPNGTIDKTSVHGSCPVIEGQKWVAIKWIRDRERD